MITVAQIKEQVSQALAEDIGGGDITAALISAETQGKATIITREAGVLCGTAFATEAFKQVDERCELNWLVDEGQWVDPDALLVQIEGPARALLTAERTALNFLQLLSGTATLAHHYAQRVSHTGVRLLDTRKTLPGLRLAQKYAVKCGGCHNHRIGLYDAFLIKENHILAAGSIGRAVSAARQIAPEKLVEVEVENQAELDQALAAGADRIMLDNFSLEDLRAAVIQVAGRAELEASGNVTEETLVTIAETGVDIISIGALTKHVKALDLSLRMA
ncbi:MAG: carboxylating nicotinate-nucleotide diphosphorylase [Halieaceae bacterium]|jgi:nicotinate-nucleotide pyrophosphorylase (carboxylating)